MNKCPVCSNVAISPFKKLMRTSPKPFKCQECGADVKISKSVEKKSIIYFFVIIVLIEFAPMLTWTYKSIAVSVLFIALIYFMACHLPIEKVEIDS